MTTKRRYARWGSFLKAHRQKAYKSARDFCSRVAVGISYPQYSRYEAGDQLPSLEQALDLCRHLGVSPLEGLLEWNRAQIQHCPGSLEIESGLDSLLAYLATYKKPEVPRSAAHRSTHQVNTQASSGFLSLDDIIVFNRSHLKVLKQDPMYRDIFTYINSFSPDWISFDELRRSIGVEKERLCVMLNQLSDLGVVMAEGDGATETENFRVSKRNFYFPDDEDFFQLRNQNLIHNARQIIQNLQFADLQKRKGFRGLITRELTEEQLDYLITRADQLVADATALPETPSPDKIYSVCLLVGERFTRNKPAPAVTSAAFIDPKTGIGLQKGTYENSTQL